MSQLRITEIFHSLQGESRSVGIPTVFVRLTGCPLRCGYCDTAYAFSGGTLRDLDDICDEVAQLGARYITVTGGEPLAQPDCLKLLSMLCDGGYVVSLETSGALDLDGVDGRVSIVMDLKTPGSGELNRNRYANLDLLANKDQVKFVVCDRADNDWAKFKIDEYRLGERVGEVLLSASHEQLAHTELANWIVEDRLNVRFQMQLHKILWGDVPGV